MHRNTLLVWDGLVRECVKKVWVKLICWPVCQKVCLKLICCWPVCHKVWFWLNFVGGWTVILCETANSMSMCSDEVDGFKQESTTNAGS